MAPARDRNDNPYEDPGGYGKYPKRSVRNQQYSPYARPPTAVRNPSLASTTSHANGWLSKLVDPAQRLITSGAHKLFASVFRKRLPPPPPPQPPESGSVSLFCFSENIPFRFFVMVISKKNFFIDLNFEFACYISIYFVFSVFSLRFEGNLGFHWVLFEMLLSK